MLPLFAVSSHRALLPHGFGLESSQRAIFPSGAYGMRHWFPAKDLVSMSLLWSNWTVPSNSVILAYQWRQYVYANDSLIRRH